MRCWRRRATAERGIAFDAALQDLAICSPNWPAARAEAVEGGMDAERMQAVAAQLDAETVQLYTRSR
jgi:hypothetical protein